MISRHRDHQFHALTETKCAQPSNAVQDCHSSDVMLCVGWPSEAWGGENQPLHALVKQCDRYAKGAMSGKKNK